MDIKTILLAGLIVGLGTAGIASTIGFSTPVHGQATVVTGGTCTGPDKSCTMVVTTPSANPAGPNTNVQSQSHTSPSAQLGGGASVISKFCPGPGNECVGGVSTPNGNSNIHLHNATSP